MDFPKRKVLMKTFITSQFRALNNRINNIHKKALKLTYKDNKSSFIQIHLYSHSVTVHHKNLQVLGTENLKLKKI